MSHPFQDLYDRIPQVKCKGHCGRDRHNTCCGPVGCTVTEALLLDQYDGKAGDWIIHGPGQVLMDMAHMLAVNRHIHCPHLGLDGRCTAYEVRPMICRLWGVMRAMACPWGCQPERWLSNEQGNALLDEARRRCIAERG